MNLIKNTFIIVNLSIHNNNESHLKHKISNSNILKQIKIKYSIIIK